MLFLIPAAGKGQRFQDAGYGVPKPFLTFNDGLSMADVVIRKADFLSAPEKFLILHEDHSDFFNELQTGAHPLTVGDTAGTSETIIAAIAALADRMDSLLDQEVLISNVDNVIRYPYEQFAAQCRSSGKPCGVVVFEAQYGDDDKYSYVNKYPFFDEVGEKRDPGYQRLAIAGLYWFRTVRDLLRAIEWQKQGIDKLNRDQEVQDFVYTGRDFDLHRQVRYKKEPYLSLAMNAFPEGGFALLVRNAEVVVFGTPDQYEAVKRTHSDNIPF